MWQQATAIRHWCLRPNKLLNTMKYEVASEIGVNLKQGYNGDISAREAGRVGGNMVKKMIQYAESSMSGGKF